MIRRMLSLALLACPLFCLAQTTENYVPDPSFEGLKRPRCRWVQSPKMFSQSFSMWTTATATHPDIFSTTLEADCWAHPNNHSEGKQLPRTGTTMVGFRTYGRGGKKGNPAAWHEYPQIELSQALEPGKLYYAEMWVARSHKAVRASNNVGMYFSDSLLDTRNRLPLCLTPQINQTEVIQGLEWVKVSGVFEAATEAKFVAIGNFYCDDNTATKKVEGTDTDAYYYVDDVMVRPALAEEARTAVPETPECLCASRVIVTKLASTAEVDLAEMEPDLGAIIELRNIYFETGKAELLSTSDAELKKLENLLYNYPNIEIEISGHTDNVGSEADNLALSLARAKAVATHLIRNKTSKSRITYRGLGETKPVATNDTEEGRAQNRRVEFTVIKN